MDSVRLTIDLEKFVPADSDFSTSDGLRGQPPSFGRFVSWLSEIKGDAISWLPGSGITNTQKLFDWGIDLAALCRRKGFQEKAVA